MNASLTAPLQTTVNDPIYIALPKGRILDELEPVLHRAGIEPEPEFNDEHSRRLQFNTNHPGIYILRVRSFDVATFVAFGAAQLGVAGSDVLMEFNYPDIYAPLDLQIGKCRISIACPESHANQVDFSRLSHISIATKYPHITQDYFANQGVQAECIKLNGAVELAPKLGLSRYIVDLVSTGKTLQANGLKETQTIADVSSRLIVNRSAFKTRGKEVGLLIERFREAVQELA
jgi:ATP phosphoribosyltransferase